MVVFRNPSPRASLVVPPQYYHTIPYHNCGGRNAGPTPSVRRKESTPQEEQQQTSPFSVSRAESRWTHLVPPQPCRSTARKATARLPLDSAKEFGGLCRRRVTCLSDTRPTVRTKNPRQRHQSPLVKASIMYTVGVRTTCAVARRSFGYCSGLDDIPGILLAFA